MSAPDDRQAYDRGVSVFSPYGRLYQVEYAREAVRNGNAVVGVRGSDGVALVADSRGRSALLVDDSVQKLHDVDGHLGAATAGHVADGRRIVDFARQRAQSERLRYGQRVDVPALSTAIADHVQEATQAGGTRPFGAGLLVGGFDGSASTDVADGRGRPRLFEVDPSGAPSEWHATAIGGGAADARAELESGYDPGMRVDAAVELAVRALATTVEDDGLTTRDVDVAVLDAEGYGTFDDDDVATVLEDADVQRAS